MENILVFRTDGGCMRPLIKDSCNVFIRRYGSQDKIRSGDIVLYELAGRKFLHRVKSVRDDRVKVTDDTGVISPVEVPLDCITGIYPTRLSGVTGAIYNFFLRKFFTSLRAIKRIFTFGCHCEER